MAQIELAIGVIVVISIIYIYVFRKIWELEEKRPTEEIIPEEGN